MQSFEISKGNTIITRADRKGTVVTGKVVSKGPKNCGVIDAEGRDWAVPYEMIIACNNEVAPTVVLEAVKGQIVVDKKGDKFKIDRVNKSRYTATNLSDGKAYYLPFHHVVEILDPKSATHDAQRAFLKGKGFTDKDVAQFEKLFNK